MTPTEYIEKYGIILAPGGQIVTTKRVPPAAVAGLRAAKPAIIAELRRRNEARIAEGRAIAEARLAQAQRVERFHLHLHDGEHLTGYTAYGAEAEALEAMGLARYVDGWGYHVPADVVKALGTEFSRAQAEALAVRRRAPVEAVERQRQERLQAALAEAARTGQPVEIERWTDECDGTVVECSIDIVRRLAMPDGTVRVERTHTY